MNKITYEGRILKTDSAQRRIRGVAFSEKIIGEEVLTFQAAKRAFADSDWDRGVFEIGQTQRAGRVIEIECDDTARRIFVSCQITDALVWEKILDGTLALYRIGGRSTESAIRAAADCPASYFSGVKVRPPKIREVRAWYIERLELADDSPNPTATFAILKGAGQGAGLRERIAASLGRLGHDINDVAAGIARYEAGLLAEMDEYDRRLDVLEHSPAKGCRLVSPQVGRC